ncbi:large subunit of alpha-aminoadipate reductase [Coemansia furcata]|nr:large subunit of alpha-aminoadipate reductase [Coemansia furcata]
MYGTTETQRAVSFCAIPPHSSNASYLATAKDVIPAGRGMKDVQLLVVNRHGSGGMCAVGEVGEIYVRSGGLAEGYLQLPEATAEKFVDNWLAPPPPQAADNGLSFYRGARDRMYRTGDLGRYRADGDVECIGRMDDQVKIRGFRIELGEINNMLAMHPRLRANVTLVRRDKYEEQTLVAYIVPSEEEQRADDPGRQQLIASVREYLRQKLPAYAVPAVFVPLRRLPLTPNGKIDRAALPFPDTPAAPPASAEGSPTERALALVWADVLGGAVAGVLAPESNFFDVGGHSVAATRMVFRVRTDFAVDAPLGLVFRCPVLRDMAAAIDALRGELQLTEAAPVGEEEEAETEYSADLAGLIAQLPAPPTHAPPAEAPEDATYLLTGATGFLGAFVLESLLRHHPRASVVCLVRAPDAQAAMARVRAAAVANLVWQDAWAGRVTAVAGDLAQPRLGLSAEDWARCAEADVIVHNGALVHWVYPYAKLRAANVLSTLEALKLAGEGRAKRLVFVSSTSALDTDHYVQLGRVSESDDLEGARRGLMSGYGQSKWVAERLLLHAAACGWPAVAIVRPGYVLGHSRSGATNADDFLWRLAKGCAQLQLAPVMANAVNVCPVDYVADVVAAAAARPITHAVYHVFNHWGFRFHDIFELMRGYGYPMADAEYMRWRGVLMDSTLDDRDSALYPLLHFVLDDLPTSTKSPDLDDRHTRELLRGAACPDIRPLFGLYLAYLVKAGFLDEPTGPAAHALPILDVEVQGLVTRKGN